MIARKESKIRRKNLALLLSLVLVTLFGLAWVIAGRPADASVPAGIVAHPPVPGRFGQPLEGGPAVAPPPFFTTSPSAPQAIDPHWSANVRANIDTTTFAQQEPSVAINPLNHLNIVAAQKDERSAPGPGTATKEVWIDTTTDGGQTWINTHIPMPGSNLPQQSDPVVNFSDNNNVYVTIIGLADSQGIGVNQTMVARSTDGGLTWPTPAVSLDPTLGGSDKEWTAIDLNPASPYYHRIYTTWTNFSAGPEFVEKWSSDSGVTWNPAGGSSYVTVSFGSFDAGQFSMPVVLPNGTVIATWNTGSVIGVGKSTDGGQSFINPNSAAVSVVGVNSVPGSIWRLNTIPSTAASQSTGTLVTVWPDGRNGKDDIYFTRSTNGGTSWSAAARIPHNTAGSSYQVEPWVSVAPNGRFDVVWYDDRNFPGNLNTFDIYASHSTDDGATWTGPDEQVTDASTNLNVGVPTGSGWNAAAGDYIGVSSVDDGAFAVWTDTRSGTNEDIYGSHYSPGPPGTPTVTLTLGPATNTPPPTGTPTNTATSTQPPATATSPATATPTGVSSTATNSPVPSDTPGEATSTSVPSATESPTTTSQSPTVTPTVCAITFSDVPPDSTFYAYIHCLACLGIINGYPDGTFKPGNDVTRGQLSKIVSNSAGFSDPQTTQMFQDVPVGSTFQVFIGRLASRGFVSGYLCGGPGEPCIGPGNLPYFRPNANASRGQISKIVSNAAGFSEPAGAQLFEDVPPSNAFYDFIQRLAYRGVIQGYPCGGPGEPCIGPGNLPYFRPTANATRGQTSKIVANTFFPDCNVVRQR